MGTGRNLNQNSKQIILIIVWRPSSQSYKPKAFDHSFHAFTPNHRLVFNYFISKSNYPLFNH